MWSSGSLTEAGSTPVTVGSGASVAGIDASLQLGGSITGTVTDAADPSGLSGVCVYATSSDGGNDYGQATTASDGTYAIIGLQADTYQVEFDPTCSGSKQTGDGTISSQVAISVGSPLELNELLPTSLLSGAVTDATTHDGLEGVCVNVYSSQQSTPIASTITATDGSYGIDGLLPGAYSVQFDPTCNGTTSSPYDPQWYPNSSTLGAGSLIQVVAGQATGGIDASLGVGGTIQGRVTDAAHSSGLAAVCVTATPVDGGAGYGTARTASDGTYAIGDLDAGSYDVRFDPTCSGTVSSRDVPLWYPSAVSESSATSVVVSWGAVVSNIDGDLIETGAIAGHVTDLSHPKGLAAVCVTASQSANNRAATATSSSNGTYLLKGLSAGKYRVEFDPTCHGKVRSRDLVKWYKSAPTAATATLVPVASGSTASGIDVVLSLGGEIIGKVTDKAHPNGRYGVCVTAVSYNGGVGYGTATTGSGGSYAIAGLAPGPYEMTFDPTCGGTVTSSDAPLTLAKPVTIQPGPAVTRTERGPLTERVHFGLCHGRSYR